MTLAITWPSSLAVVDRAARLRESAAPLRAACRAHPFVRGIADGSLPPEVFARWVVQDWRYLLTYVEVLEQVAATAPSAAAGERWAELATFTRNEELALHRAYAARFDLTEADLDGAADAPATAAYTGFLRAQAQRSYGHGVASLVPCGVGYVTLATELAAGPPPAEPRYADWIHTYADPAFAEAVAWMEAELDGALGDDASLAATYLAGAEHELAFWDQLWQGWSL
ncbi:MAG: thiaminase/transcriptional activator TenA [Polyangiales bacterium]|jgi:thiaminase/transcriptional activator TenA